MMIPAADTRSNERKLLDEKIASEPPLPVPELPEGTKGRPVEELLASRLKPVASAHDLTSQSE
jgi:hypothetical protein